MAEVGDYTIIILQGATWTRTITVQDDGAARDLTDYTIRLQAREEKDSDSTFLDINTTSGEIVITDAANGIFTITLSATTTANLSAVSGYVYDLELEAPNGTVTRLLEGPFSVKREVTR